MILAIDPGTTHSGVALIGRRSRKAYWVAKLPNEELLAILTGVAGPDGEAKMASVTHVAIEMVASYGMAVGEEVFETVVWIGRFQQAIEDWWGLSARRVKRIEVKLHHCHVSSAKDANITQALIDRFAMGEPNRGKGTKAKPGWFFGFAADIWQAYALAVLESDLLETSRQEASPN